MWLIIWWGWRSGATFIFGIWSMNINIRGPWRRSIHNNNNNKEIIMGRLIIIVIVIIVIVIMGRMGKGLRGSL